MRDDSNIIQLLKKHVELLEKSLDSLQMSVEKASRMIKQDDDEYTFEEMETFDSLTSKFGRTSDIYLQKVIRNIWILLHEDTMPLIDVLNKAEKTGMIRSADTMLEIRDLRNQITHEYIPEAIQEMIPDVIDLTNDLTENIETTKMFIAQRKWL